MSCDNCPNQGNSQSVNPAIFSFAALTGRLSNNCATTLNAICQCEFSSSTPSSEVATDSIKLLFSWTRPPFLQSLLLRYALYSLLSVIFNLRVVSEYLNLKVHDEVHLSIVSKYGLLGFILTIDILLQTALCRNPIHRARFTTLIQAHLGSLRFLPPKRSLHL